MKVNKPLTPQQLKMKRWMETRDNIICSGKYYHHLMTKTIGIPKSKFNGNTNNITSNRKTQTN
jgi:hypothetical protein